MTHQINYILNSTMPGECEVVDCQVTMWSEWRVARTARYRKRMVTQQANEHGQRCPKLMEVTCKLKT